MMHLLPIWNYRFSGTIVGIEDNKSSGWADSLWRSLKVNLFILLFFCPWSKNVLRVSELLGIP